MISTFRSIKFLRKRGKIKLPIRVMMRSTQENKEAREKERESKVHCVSASTIPFRLCAAAPEQFVASVHPRGLFFSFPCQEVECFKSFVYFPPLTKRRHSKEQIHSRYTRISPSKLFLIHPWRIGLDRVFHSDRDDRRRRRRRRRRRKKRKISSP